jgi:co-chaperonin GroES (HSP10)
MILMSDLLLPQYLKDLIKQEKDLTSEAVDAPGDEDKARQLPRPVGHKILCAVPPAGDTFDDSLIAKASVSQRIEEQTTTVLFVVALGPDAYKDKNRFPSGPWCKEGDFVLVRAYSGTRFQIHGRDFRMIFDDQVDGTVEDPRGYARAA